MNRILVVTFNFGSYDKLYPPTHYEDDVDYAVFTDDADLMIPGWTTVPVDVSRFVSPKAATIYHVAFGHRILSGYDYSVVIGGNFRIIRRVRPFVERYATVDFPISGYAHPGRDTVAAEAAVCISDGKVKDPDLLRQQVAAYTAEGFPDDLGLLETGVTVRNHAHPDFEKLMEAWWAEFERWPTRDQVSLPVALWRTGTRAAVIPGSFRDPNSGFHLTPHVSRSDMTPTYAHVHAMSATSLPHRILLSLWHAKWGVERMIRRLRGGAG